MAKNLKELVDLGIIAANGQVPTQYSNDYTSYEANEALREELKELAKDYNSYRRNKTTIFEIIEKVADAIVPNKVEAQMGQFAEVMQFAQGQKATFKRKLGKNRAKSTYVTTSAIGGVFRVARLDSTSLELTPYAHGGGSIISFEEFLDGTIDMGDIMDIVVEGLTEAVFSDIQGALMSSYSATGRPSNTVAGSASFDMDSLMGVINTVRRYGSNATVVTTYDFATLMRPVYGVVGTYGNNVLLEDAQDIRNQGYVGMVNGAPVVILNNSFTDETNAHNVLNPKLAYVFASGGSSSEKPVKVAFEGQTIIDEVKNADRSMEFQGYKKSSVGILSTNNWGIYENRGVSDVGSDFDNLSA